MKAKLLMLFFAAFSLPVFSQCWTQVAAGHSHTLGIKSDGTLWAWGLNDRGQLGDGTTINKNEPVQIGTDTDWWKIDAEGYNSLALKTNGTLWSWGSNNAGQIGDGNFGSTINVTSPLQIGTDSDWVVIEAARAFAIKNDGTLWGWGKNDQGHLGTGDTNPYYTPVQIGSDNDWADVSSGGNQTLAIKTNGTLWGWGLNHSGSLGIGPVSNFVMEPTQTGNNSADWAKISVGGCCSSKMIKTDGTLWAMGNGNQGNIGDGLWTDVNSPTQIGTDTDWNQVAVSNHTLALKNNHLWTWGYNGAGQLGNGNLLNSNNSGQVGIGEWQDIATGVNSSVAIDAAGSLYTWGWNNQGQLGDGTFADKNVPTLIGFACTLKNAAFNFRDAVNFAPNPVSDYAKIRYYLKQTSTVEIKVTSLAGRVVFEKCQDGLIGDNQFSLDLTHYTTGLYLLTLKTAAGSATVKVIKTSP